MSMDVSNISSQQVQKTHPHHQTQSPSDRIKKMQEQIDQGVKSGKLTTAQAADMKKQLDALQAAIQSDMTANGGKLTADQSRQINKQLNQLSRNLYTTLNPSAAADSDDVLKA
jgi:hypothetical protein